MEFFGNGTLLKQLNNTSVSKQYKCIDDPASKKTLPRSKSFDPFHVAQSFIR